jgi:site-specific recombinase XerD
MNALRRRMLEDLQLRGLAPKTQQCYLDAVKRLAHHYRRAPDQISEEELRQYFLYLINAKQVAESTLRIHLYGIRFFYERTLQRPWPVFELIRPRKRQKLPVVLSVQEVRHVLGLVHNRKAQMCLRMIYACGLRLTEGTRLQVSDIDPARMLVRVSNGKGGKDRFVPLAPRVLELLREYWQIARPRPWLFPARHRPTPLSPTTLQKTFKVVVRRSGLAKDASIHTVRHSYATHLGVSVQFMLKPTISCACKINSLAFYGVGFSCRINSFLRLVCVLGSGIGPLACSGRGLENQTVTVSGHRKLQHVTQVDPLNVHRCNVAQLIPLDTPRSRVLPRI